MTYILPSKKGIFVRDQRGSYFINRPFFSLWNYRNLKNRSLIIGYVGARGSGKSNAAARTIILDYMMLGKLVWSNMDIEFNLIKDGKAINMKSQPLNRLSLVELDDVFKNGLIYLDEVNLMMEARRSMSQENLMLSYIVQQLRKRKLNILWSAQSEMHCDDRLRFATDIFITCQDISINRPNCGIGELSLWKAHDYSGVIKGRTPNDSKSAIFFEGIQWNKPWWNTYDTEQIQDLDMPAPDNADNLEKETDDITRDIANYVMNSAPVDKDIIYQKWGIKDRLLRQKIGVKLSTEYGIVKRWNKYRLLDAIEV